MNSNVNSIFVLKCGDHWYMYKKLIQYVYKCFDVPFNFILIYAYVIYFRTSLINCRDNILHSIIFFRFVHMIEFYAPSNET